ncbi:BZ3500_MvSof-1268-A1-R1_Chr1-3g01916 [Microbotryum saponariae]|uniref:BZ3500_MvSof-1268-A1-R1_Chr1-3g01916 protein n=1 Tax=Microbotryum saponariae TaxID=289078 RepID=A0A2X0KAP2_9BASI|nr:BZ3500_MvSof-1268-A1-R1_Chr1-3g01916 [Microbotryum saponariae]SCZ94892.1 BZ3501_MvSof-1269-A2-R1_Chr1-3g01518 [Microbotryum saponariae]
MGRAIGWAQRRRRLSSRSLFPRNTLDGETTRTSSIPLVQPRTKKRGSACSFGQGRVCRLSRVALPRPNTRRGDPFSGCSNPTAVRAMVKQSRSLSLARHPSTAPHVPSLFKKSASLSGLSEWMYLDSGSSTPQLLPVHMLFFLFMPLVSSGIFYASNGATKVAYVDALFMTVSASTVTGLNSALLGPLTRWQQTILFINMCVGSTVFVSLITIVIRLSFFRRKFEYMVEHDPAARQRVNRVGAEEAQLEGRSFRPFPIHLRASDIEFATHSPAGSSPIWTREEKKEGGAKKKKKKGPLRTDMITRVDVPVRVNQMNVTGWLSDEAKAAEELATTTQAEGTIKAGEFGGVITAEPKAAEEPVAPSAPHATAIHIDDSTKPDRSHRHIRRTSDPTAHAPAPLSPTYQSVGLPRVMTLDTHHEHDHRHGSLTSPASPDFPRSRTIEFRDNGDSNLRMRRTRTGAQDVDVRRRQSQGNLRDIEARTLTRTGTNAPDALNTGFGGFPNPIVVAADYARKRIPVFNTVVERNLTLPPTQTLASVHSGLGPPTDTQNLKPVSYISFDAVVGRNSKFRGLTSAQQEELGGVEYRALQLLLRIVFAYWIGLQLIAVLVLAPWLTYSEKYRPVFEDPQWAVSPTWFVFFQVWSAFSNNGMSLVDASMVPFQQAYLLIVVMSILILGGNTAYPVFLRICIWIISKLVPRRSRTRETLQFLLDHPRRCYIYLFPSHQTWFLVFVLVILNSIDWISFIVLDIGNTEIERLPVGTRIIDGLLQAFAVRAAGFAIVTLSAVAPALQLLYVVMMYVAVYPIAVSIRSTNVYEEKSMGVFEEEEDEDDVEARFEKSHSASQYISYHARKQLAFDMWWLVLAVWLICIIERRLIGDLEYPEVTIFTIMFEVASAYGTVGLSLGTSRKNTSLSGILRTLSKLVLCAVMFRGRHRGLPVAIDRSILLPSEIKTAETGSTRGDGASARRGSRSSYASSGRDEGGPGGEGGLETVEPETDEARTERVRHESGRENSGGEAYGFEYTKPPTKPLSRPEDESNKSDSNEGGVSNTSDNTISETR